MELWLLSTFLLIGSLLFPRPASALPIQETLYYEGVPTRSMIARWATLPAAPDFQISMDHPGVTDLTPLVDLARTAGHLRLQVRQHIDEYTVPVWKQLAARGAELVTLMAGVPTELQIERLNRIGFRRILIVMDYVPSRVQAERLNRLQGDVSVTFAHGLYPKFLEKPQFLMIPTSIRLNFANEFWPRYNEMDVLNMLPHPKRLIVKKDVFPTDVEHDYLRNLRQLEEATYETEWDEPRGQDWGAEWRKLGALPVKWSAFGFVPSGRSLRDFEASGPAGARSLRVVVDRDPSPAQRRYLADSGVPVEINRLAP